MSNNPIEGYSHMERNTEFESVAEHAPVALVVDRNRYCRSQINLAKEGPSRAP